MIRGLLNGNTSGYLHVDGGHQPVPYINTNRNIPLQGVVRWMDGNLEVFDGTTWQHFGGDLPSIHLSNSAIDALDWVTAKMTEEAKIRQLASKSVTVADALARYEHAKEQLDVVVELAKE
jgi:hypothetical protein